MRRQTCLHLSSRLERWSCSSTVPACCRCPRFPQHHRTPAAPPCSVRPTLKPVQTAPWSNRPRSRHTHTQCSRSCAQIRDNYQAGSWEMRTCRHVPTHMTMRHTRSGSNRHTNKRRRAARKREWGKTRRNESIAPTPNITTTRRQERPQTQKNACTEERGKCDGAGGRGRVKRDRRKE